MILAPAGDGWLVSRTNATGGVDHQPAAAVDSRRILHRRLFRKHEERPVVSSRVVCLARFPQHAFTYLESPRSGHTSFGIAAAFAPSCGSLSPKEARFAHSSGSGGENISRSPYTPRWQSSRAPSFSQDTEETIQNPSSTVVAYWLQARVPPYLPPCPSCRQ